MKVDATELLMVRISRRATRRRPSMPLAEYCKSIPTMFAHWRCWPTTTAWPQPRVVRRCAGNLAKAQQYGQQGLQALQSMPKPDGMSDADFTKLHNELGAIFDGGHGFAALQTKDYATRKKTSSEAVAWEVPAQHC